MNNLCKATFSAVGLAAMSGVLLGWQTALLAQDNTANPSATDTAQSAAGSLIFPVIAYGFMIVAFVVGMYVMFTRKSRQRQ